MATARDALLENEAFVAWLILSSQAARSAGSKFLGGGTADSMLTAMYAPETLREIREHFGCEEAEVFQKLAAVVRSNYDRPLPRFTFNHLMRLAEKKIRQGLAGLLHLHCSEDKVMDHLFDARKMRATLGKVSPKKKPGPGQKAESIYYTVLREIQVNGVMFRALFTISKDDWGHFLLSQQWLSDEGLEVLEHLAGERQWIGHSPANVLAQLIDESLSDSSTEPPPHVITFDGLAVNYLQARLRLASQELSNRSVEQSRQALQKAPSFLAVRCLPVWLEFYRGNVASAFKSLVSGLQWDTLETLIGADNLETHETKGDVVTDQPFSVQLGEMKSLGQEQNRRLTHLDEVTFLNSASQASSAVRDIEIYCPTRQDGVVKKELILKCRQVSDHLSREIQNSLETVTPAEFLPHFDSLVEGVLTFSIPKVKQKMDVIVEAVRQVIPELVQCLVLCGVGLKLSTKSPWEEHLNEIKRFIPFSNAKDETTEESLPQKRKDIIFQLSAEKVRQQLQQRYEDEGRQVQFYPDR